MEVKMAAVNEMINKYEGVLHLLLFVYELYE